MDKLARQNCNKFLIYEFSCPFNLSHLKISYNPIYPTNPKTFGEKLRKWRLDNNITAKQLAKTLGVCKETVLNWERGKKKPLPSVLRKLVKITGIKTRYLAKDNRKYKPAPNSLGEKLRKKRIQLGLTQQELAKLLGVSYYTIANWETGRRGKGISLRNKEKIEEFLKNN